MKKRSVLIHGSVLLAIFLIGFGPLLISLAAGAFANINDCTLHEGFVNPCIVFGLDWGETLYTMGTLGWLSLASLPLAFVFLGLYLAFLLVRWLRGRKEKPAAS